MKLTASYQPKAWMLLVLLFIVVSSCTVHKRVHRKGWYVEWHGINRASKSVVQEQSAENSVPNDHKEGVVLSEIRKEAVDSNIQLATSEVPTSNPVTPRMLPQPTENHRKASQHTTTEDHHIEKVSPKSSRTKNSYDEFPNRVPTLAYVLLYAGLLLLAIGIIGAIYFAAVNLSFIGLPFIYVASLLAGVLLLILATGVALESQKSQPSSPDPRYEKQEPKKEKKERQPLKKNDKIFLSIIGAVLIAILLVATVF